MKQNVEAWQHGLDDGWDDGYYDRPHRHSFNDSMFTTLAEKEHYERGYELGFDEGSTNC